MFHSGIPGNAFKVLHHRPANTASEVERRDNHSVNSLSCNIEHAARHELTVDLCKV